MDELNTTIVIPTVARPSLDVLLSRLETATGPRPAGIIVVDDRPEQPNAVEHADRRQHEAASRRPHVRVLRAGGRGPAAARNLGWRSSRTTWVSFLDDDVVPDPDWLHRLADDLMSATADVDGIQGVVTVPLPGGRRPTDWERSVAGLENAAWITADMTYRRRALAAVGGFDERFRRAYREDADLALRVLAQGGRLVRGRRRVTHPVRPSSAWASVKAQAGNADDVLMRRLHGPRWRDVAMAPRGRRPVHLALTSAAFAAVAAVALRRPSAAAVAAVGWLGGTAEFAASRISRGPLELREVARMVVTSALIPPTATYHVIRGAVRHRRRPQPWRGIPDLVLFDRDGTLIHDVPYNGDPERVEPVHGAGLALERLRRAGLRLGIVTNQSGVASGRLVSDDVDRVNHRVDELLGPFDVWRVCLHGQGDGCACRKPAPGMVTSACAALDIDPARCAVVGDTGTDLAAAAAAGARGFLVPTAQTRTSEVRAAERVAAGLPAAVEAILEGSW